MEEAPLGAAGFCGGGFAIGHTFGVRVQRVQKVQRIQRGRLTALWAEGCGRLSAAGYVRFAQGATALTGRGLWIALRAMLIKSALRDWLSVSYGMISTTVISHLRWLSPLWCLTAPPSPRGIGRATKGKRLYGQARRLTSPDLHILCRMCTVDNKDSQSSPFISSS